MSVASAKTHLFGSWFTSASTYSTTTDSRGVVHVIQTHGSTAASKDIRPAVVDYGE